MGKKSIYIAQLGTGSNINLLPLAAGQIKARLKQNTNILRDYNIGEIIFRREDPQDIVARMDNVAVIGFSCFSWNLNISLQTAQQVRTRFPGALIVFGGPAVPKETETAKVFFHNYPSVDIVCIGEGEDVFSELCLCPEKRDHFAEIPGLIYRDDWSDTILYSKAEEFPLLNDIPSPYLDGTFDDFYNQYKYEFSGVIWETNRGCPYNCAFCTWGNQKNKKIREKPFEQVIGEIEWIGKNKVQYVAMTDANFGIRKRDLDIACLLAECKEKYGAPKFISVSWAKYSSDTVLKIAEIFKRSGIGFRITLSLQSLKEDVLKAVNRTNLNREYFEEIKRGYEIQKVYSYTELILGLPLETYESFVSGIEASLSSSIYDQLYIYPLFLFPNTKISSLSTRRKYGIKSKQMESRYTKSKENVNVKEYVEIVIGTSSMPDEKWIDSFVIAYYTLAIHDDRLAFFILTYLKKTYGVNITDIVSFARNICSSLDLPIFKKSFAKLENCARGVQTDGRSHLIEPDAFGGMPYDPPEGIFLDLLIKKHDFYKEFLIVVESFFSSRNLIFDQTVLRDLFSFQEHIMAHPEGPKQKILSLKYNWIKYFLFTFKLPPEELHPMQAKLKVIDPAPSNCDPSQYLKNHFDVRGVPAFNQLFDDQDNLIFPPVNLKHQNQ